MKERTITIAGRLRSLIPSIGIEHADEFAEITQAAFELPPELRPLLKGHIGKPGWHNYLAFDGILPIYAASMFIMGESARLSFGSTLNTHRKHGGQSTLFARRIEDGLTMGCK